MRETPQRHTDMLAAITSFVTDSALAAADRGVLQETNFDIQMLLALCLETRHFVLIKKCYIVV